LITVDSVLRVLNLFQQYLGVTFYPGRDSKGSLFESSDDWQWPEFDGFNSGNPDINVLQGQHRRPILNPLRFKYPKDPNTFGIDLQFPCGDTILVSLVIEGNLTSVDIYLSNDVFYDFKNYSTIQGEGKTVMLTDIQFSDIPVYIRGGSTWILSLQVISAMITVSELRKTDFEIVVAVGRDGIATGSLHFNGGESILAQT
jgi:alpha-glucosidase (family GH31 glycosyl hydrolase)